MNHQSNFKKKSIFKRLFMSLPELETYHAEWRKERFQQGVKLKNIRFREKIYPVFILFLKLDRLFRKQTITVIGARKKYKEQVIYACTHIGGNDLENVYEAIRRGCWWFVGDPCVLYKDISGLLLHLNGCIMLELTDRDDRRIANKRALEVLKGGGSLLIFPEGARNGTENLPVTGLFPGAARMAMETGVKIVPIGIEQYDNRYVINFGNLLLPENFENHADLTQSLRDELATLKFEIWQNEGLKSRSDLPNNYSEQFADEFEKRILPWDTRETVERSRFHSKEEQEQKEAFAHMDNLVPNSKNAFLFRKR